EVTEASSLTGSARLSGALGRPHDARLPHRREGRRHEQLVFLPDRPHASLGRPRSATLAGFLAHTGTLVEILVDPGVDELVQAPELARPAGRQGRELLPVGNGRGPRLQNLRDLARVVSIDAHLIHVP